MATCSSRWRAWRSVWFPFTGLLTVIKKNTAKTKHNYYNLALHKPIGITIFMPMFCIHCVTTGLCRLLFLLCGMQCSSSASRMATRCTWYSAVAMHEVFVVVHMYAQLPAVWFLSKKGLKITVFFLNFWSNPLTDFNINYLLNILSTSSYTVCSQQVWKQSIKGPISWQTYRDTDGGCYFISIDSII